MFSLKFLLSKLIQKIAIPEVRDSYLHKNAKLSPGSVFKFSKIGDVPNIDVGGILIFAVICGVAALFKLVLKKRPSPILMIVISAGLGMLVYSFV